MQKRTRTRQQTQYLGHPAFLKKYFHRKYAWVTTVVLITPLLIWGICMALFDLLGLREDPDFDIVTDLIFIFGGTLVFFLIVREYIFYKKELWGKKTKRRAKQ